MSAHEEDNAVIKPNVSLNTFDEVDNVRHIGKRVEFHLTRLSDQLSGWANYKRFEGGGKHRLIEAFLANPRNKSKYEEIKEKVKLLSEASRNSGVNDDEEHPISGVKDVRRVDGMIQFLVIWEETNSEEWISELNLIGGSKNFYFPSFVKNPANKAKLDRFKMEDEIEDYEDDWTTPENTQEKKEAKNGTNAGDIFEKGQITGIRYNSFGKLEFLCSRNNGHDEHKSWKLLKKIHGRFDNKCVKKFKEDNGVAYDEALKAYSKDIQEAYKFYNKTDDEKKCDGKKKEDKASKGKTPDRQMITGWQPAEDDQPGPSQPKKRKVQLKGTEEKNDKKTEKHVIGATSSTVPNLNLQPTKGFFRSEIRVLSGEEKELAKKEQDELKMQLFNIITKGDFSDCVEYIKDGCPLNLELANGPFIYSVLKFEQEECLKLMIRRGLSLDSVPEKYIDLPARLIHGEYQRKLHEAFDVLFKTEFSGKIGISKTEKLITVPTHWRGLSHLTQKFHLDEEFKDVVPGKLGFVVFSAEWKEVEGQFVVTTALPTQMELAFNGNEVSRNRIHPNIATTNEKPIIGHLNKLKVSLYGLNKKMPFIVIMPVFITSTPEKRYK
ncbi:hypothetical protein CAEBREN_04943 [Caenorhabditis brenneri]|uniref:Chromo domain-containing protein n=1 Tax=Caenorhabditis brenneri TaxID=135651 RepID=G0N4J5_CAEBE|nr:hypothetical protein CAEBREN_04943 [Caenorhabditis brenneri]